jgi:hemoglobin
MHRMNTSSMSASQGREITEQDIERLVHTFYARVRMDPLLGPIFESQVHDWDSHLQTLVRFWCWQVLKQPGYAGSPMAQHARLPNLSWAHFEGWLKLFRQTLLDMGLPALHSVLDELAQQMAQRLWAHYQSRYAPSRWLREVPDGLVCDQQSPLYSHENLPNALQTSHRLKPGVWGLLRVREGSLVFTLDGKTAHTILLNSGEQLVVEPELAHHVTCLGPALLQIDFYRAPAG